jgi:hypothetical protein
MGLRTRRYVREAELALDNLQVNFAANQEAQHASLVDQSDWQQPIV